MEQCQDSLDILPAELWTCIAEQSPASWFALCCSMRWLGLYSLRARVQQQLMDRWVDRKTGLLPNGAEHGMHVHDMIYFPAAHKLEMWYRNGVMHRDGDLPAKICYREHGTASSETRLRDDNVHREDGPARKWYYENGTLVYEAWYRNGELHRDGDLRAVTMYHEDGTLTYETYISFHC